VSERKYAITLNNGSANCSANGVRALTDGYIFTGHAHTSTSATPADLWIVRVDLNGNVLWAKTFGGDLNDAGLDLTLAEGPYCVVTASRAEDGRLPRE